MIIEPGDASEASATAFAELKNMATGFTLQATLGARHREIMRQLYCSGDTLQSYTRTTVARFDHQIAGHLCWIPATEYGARARASDRIIRHVSRAAGVRISVARLRRWLSGVSLGPWQNEQLYIESLAVHAAMQRRGVATALLDHAQQLAMHRSCTTLALNTLADNAAALALYQQNGFTVHLRRRRHLRMMKAVAMTDRPTHGSGR